MMGGEGNAYGNVFDNVAYCNPYFRPVDFDFHGFSEGPMSPPSHNLFINCYGFRGIKGAGLLTIYLRVVNLMYGLTLIGKGELLSHLFFVGDAIPSSLQKEQIIK